MPQKKDRHGDRARESRQKEFARTLERVNLERKGVSLLHRWVINDLLLHHIFTTKPNSFKPENNKA